MLNRKKVKNAIVCVIHNKYDGKVLEVLGGKGGNTSSRNSYYCVFKKDQILLLPIWPGNLLKM